MMTVERGAAAHVHAAAPRLEVQNLDVTFANNRVLRDVTLDVRPGEIHGLIGQNGSGKSTLAKVLTGLYVPDSGAQISVDGIPLKLPVKPRNSRERGVAVVHQSLGLIDSETVLENMRIGRHTGSRILRKIDWNRERSAAEAVFERLGGSVPLDARVGDLREEDRATVAIGRALQDARAGSGIIIFDESTRALGRPALEHFFEILDGVVAAGTSVLLITHRLEEIVDGADRVTVLRDGRVVESGYDVAGMTEAQLTSLMLGHELAARPAAGRHALDTQAPEIRVENVSGESVSDLTFTVRHGEVLGLTGVAGAGHEDVPYLLSGAAPASAGTLTLGTRHEVVSALTPQRSIEAGISLVPEGRETAGLAMGMSVAENSAFSHSSRAKQSLRPLRLEEEKDRILDWIDRLDIRPQDPKASVGTLSGGNQQKVLLAKWLATNPELLLLHEPTQAVDVGARSTIIEAIRAAVGRGCAAIVVSGDENELSLLCDRVLVFDEGVVREELTDDLGPDRIVASIYVSQTRSPLRARTAEAVDQKDEE